MMRVPDPLLPRHFGGFMALVALSVLSMPGVGGAQVVPDLPERPAEPESPEDPASPSPDETAQLPLAVFGMRFDKDDTGINFRPFIGGFLVAPAAGGSGTMILRGSADGQRGYRVLENFGELFASRERGRVRTVMRAGRETEVETSAFVAFGDVEEILKVQTDTVTTEVEVARVMTGRMIFVDTEQDLPFAGFQLDSGSVGFARLTLRLDPRTRDWNRRQASLEQVVGELVDNLEARGDVNFEIDTTAGAGGR